MRIFFFIAVLQSWPVLPDDLKNTSEIFFFFVPIRLIFHQRQHLIAFAFFFFYPLVSKYGYKELGFTIDVDSSGKTCAVSVNNTSFTIPVSVNSINQTLLI